MIAELIATTPMPVFFLGMAIIIFIACEIGFLFGRRHRRTLRDTEAPSSIGSMVAGLLSMLAFILALTFSIAIEQYHERKSNVVSEAAAIHSAYLLADLVAAPHNVEIKRLLRSYVEVRLQVVQNRDLESAISKSLEIYQSLWEQTVEIAPLTRDGIMGVVAPSIIEVINLGERRKISALHSQIPQSVWAGLLIITLLSVAILGLQLGFYGKRRLIALIPLTLAFAVLITLVVDLDRPQSGFITVNQGAMLDIQAMMDR